MTVDQQLSQLTERVMTLSEHQAKAEAEHERFIEVINELQEDVKTTKALSEDIHIMALNMERMQETLNETNKKVDDLTSESYNKYKENRKLIKQNVIGVVVGSVVTALIGGIVFFVKFLIEKGVV